MKESILNAKDQLKWIKSMCNKVVKRNTRVTR